MRDTHGMDARELDETAPERRSLAAALVDILPLPALAVRPDGAILLANGAAEDVFLRGEAGLRRQGMAGLLAADSPIREWVTRAWQALTPVSARDVAVRGPGFAEFVCDLTAAPSEEGGFVALIFKVRARGRELSGRLQEPSGARSIAALGRTLAHEVKNPLAGIRGAAQLLARDVTGESRPLVDLIVEETDRVRRLIDRMESFGADAPVRFEPVNVHAALERVATLAENGFAGAVKVRRRFDPSIPDTLGDADQLMQVFLNLARNAVEAAAARPDGAQLIVSTAWRHGLRVRGLTGETRDLPLEIGFQDNGPGVAEELRDCLFEPFVSTKPGGGGLGLPLVQKIVAAHGGVVDFESEPGRTLFRVRLPLSSPRATVARLDLPGTGS